MSGAERLSNFKHIFLHFHVQLHFSSPEVYHEIYNSRNRWSRDPSLYHVFAMSLSLLTMMDYPSAKKRRDILQPLFSHKAIQDLQHLVQAKVILLLLPLI